MVAVVFSFTDSQHSAPEDVVHAGQQNFARHHIHGLFSGSPSNPLSANQTPVISCTRSQTRLTSLTKQTLNQNQAKLYTDHNANI
jgi:hypothetical protein